MSGSRATTRKLVEHVVASLSAAADADKARAMAAYMKTEMPFYGVQAPQRRSLGRDLRRLFPLTSQSAYEGAVRALWRLPHREGKYAAIDLAQRWPRFITGASLELYEQLIRQGQWWDLVDDVAIRLVGRVWRDERKTVARLMDSWIDDDNLWIRRAALLGQNKHRDETDERRLWRYCRRRADETEFFIRKGIGCALREYSHAAPKRVRQFVETRRHELSGLSYREATRALVRRGLMQPS